MSYRERRTQRILLSPKLVWPCLHPALQGPSAKGIREPAPGGLEDWVQHHRLNIQLKEMEMDHGKREF